MNDYWFPTIEPKRFLEEVQLRLALQLGDPLHWVLPQEINREMEGLGEIERNREFKTLV